MRCSSPAGSDGDWASGLEPHKDNIPRPVRQAEFQSVSAWMDTAELLASSCPAASYVWHVTSGAGWTQARGHFRRKLDTGENCDIRQVRART